MGKFSAARRLLHALASAVTNRLSGREFTCGDCERSHRCGSPPTAECIVKLAQIERDPTGYGRRMKARSAAANWSYWS
jgi:hypothetical protein